MGLAVVVDGRVVYGDPSELRQQQMVEIGEELDRLGSEVDKLMASLEAAKSLLLRMSEIVEPENIDPHPRRTAQVKRHG
jgi:hypothetical protein